MLGQRASLVPLMRREYVGVNGVLCHLIDDPNAVFPTWCNTDSSSSNTKPGTTVASKVAVLRTLVELHEHYPTLTDPTGYSRVHLICSLHSPGQKQVLRVLCSSNKAAVNALDNMHRTPLHHALSPQNLKYHTIFGGGKYLVPLIKELIYLGANVNALDIHGISPLHLALDVGFAGWLMMLPSVIEMLIAAGADVSHPVPTQIQKYSIQTADDIPYPDRTTVVHLACRMRGPKSVDAIKLLHSSENIDCRDSYQRTPLHDLVGSIGETPSNTHSVRDDEDLVLLKLKILLGSGSSVNAQDVEGATPLCVAIQKHNFKICFPVIKALIENGADVNVRFSDECVTPMHLLCQHFHHFLPCLLPDFLAAGGQINEIDRRRQTPLLYAVKSPRCQVATLECLYNSGANVTAGDVENLNCLHVVCSQQYPNSKGLVKFLVNKGCKINQQNLEGETPLLLYLLYGCDLKFVETLLSLGADVNILNNNGTGALHRVCQTSCRSDDELVDIILRRGAKVNCVDGSNCTPLLYEIKKDDGGDCMNMKTVELLLLAGADPNTGGEAGVKPLHIACTRKDSTLTELLLKFGADVDVTDSNGCTPLHCAIQISWDRWRNCPSDHIVDMILKRGPNVNAIDRFNATPLMYEIQKSSMNLRTVHLLLVAGADPNGLSDKMPLHLAASNGNPSATKLLLDFGADVNLVDTSGLTPLHRAAKSTKGDPIKTLMVLIDGGADPSVTDSNNYTPLMSATCVTNGFLIPYVAIMMSAGRYSTSEEEQNYFRSNFSDLFTACVEKAPLVKDILVGRTRTTVAEFLLEPPDRVRRMLRNPENRIHCNSILAGTSFYPFCDLIRNRRELLTDMNDLEDRAVSSLSGFHSIQLPLLVSEQILSYLTDQDLISLSFVFNAY